MLGFWFVIIGISGRLQFWQKVRFAQVVFTKS